jgi:hypothetical protein
MSTFAVLYILDDILFNENLSAGIVSYSLEHAQFIFKRIIGHALDTFPERLKPYIGIKQRTAREIAFDNGSSLRVDTTLRGAAYSPVLVSEFGKTCSRNPIKAEEVITGTLQAVPLHGRIIIESTGEGNEGFFADMVYKAINRGNDNLTPLDYKLFFYPWYLDPNYQSDSKLFFDINDQDYFDKIEKEANVKITYPQRQWYIQQKSVLGDKIKQEFPSSVKESFLASSDAFYYAHSIERAYQSNRMLSVQIYDPLESVYVAMDIGVNDLTVIIFFQVIHGEIRIIDMYADTGKGVDFYARHMLVDKKYLINSLFLPHDANHRDGIIVENTYEREFRKLFSHTETKIIVLKRSDLNLGISHAKLKMERAVFNLLKVKPLVEHLAKYRKKWSEQYGKYLDEPFHDVHSNYADAFRYVMQAVSHIETVETNRGALEKHKKVVDNRRLMV